MPARSPQRNRLAKPLPEPWRKFLIERGVPKRKYTAVCSVSLADGRQLNDVIVEEGWVISVGKAGLAGIFEQRIEFDPREIVEMEMVQFV